MNLSFSLSIFALASTNNIVSSFVHHPTFSGIQKVNDLLPLSSRDILPWRGMRTSLRMSDTNVEDDDELVEPGQLKVSEIKAELKMRGVNFSDCFDKDSLVERLREARSTGKADPSILDEFNKINSSNDGTSTSSINDDDIEQALGNDGKLPGGMSPDMVQSLMKNPELMALLQDPKMQECMTIMMTEGQEALENKMASDSELREKVMKLNKIMASSM